MKCERCQKNPARVRVDQMVDGRHVSHFLCQSCIDELMSTVGQASVFNGQGTSSANAPFGSSPHSALLKQGTQFLTALAEWEQTLASITWHDLASEATQGHVALFCVDMVNGFCHAGMLASPRIEAIIPEVVAVFRGAYSIGVRNFILAQDCHTPDSVEFAAFPLIVKQAQVKPKTFQNWPTYPLQISIQQSKKLTQRIPRHKAYCLDRGTPRSQHRYRRR